MSLLPGYCSMDGCESPSMSGKPWCFTHNKGLIKLDRELKKPAEERKGVNKISEHRKQDIERYKPLRDKFLTENPVCGICNTAPSVEVHHMKGKENDLLCEVQWFLAVCRPCHDHVTEDSAFAIREGYSISRTKPGAAANPVKDKTI